MAFEITFMVAGFLLCMYAVAGLVRDHRNRHRRRALARPPVPGDRAVQRAGDMGCTDQERRAEIRLLRSWLRREVPR